MSYLHTDLDRLPVSALGVRDALGVILAVINHRLLVPGLLLQREDDASDVHVAVRKRERGGSSVMLYLGLFTDRTPACTWRVRWN